MADETVNYTIELPQIPPMPQLEEFIKAGGQSEWLGELYLAALVSWQAVAITVSEAQKEIIQITHNKHR